MQILHLGKYYPPHKGGMERVLQNLCEGHSERAQVTALVINETRSTVQERMCGVRVIRAGCIGTPLSVPISPGLVYWLGRLRADVIVHHEPNPVALLSFLLMRPRTPLVMWFHSDIVRQRAFYGAYRPFLRRGLQLARAIVVASPNHVRFTPILEEFSEKCCVVPFGIDPRRFALSSEIESRAAAIRVRSELPIVLFVGRLAYYKGVEYLIDAMSRIHARLILVGSGPMDQEVRRRSASVPTSGRIEFAGELSDVELVAHFHACDVFVLPSIERSEAFGVVQLEAMASGKPVVSTNLPSGVPWVNQHGLTGQVVPPANSEALAEAVNGLLKDPYLRKRLGEAGRRRVEMEFTIPRMTEAFWEILSEAQQGRVSEARRYRREGDEHRRH
jgi:glycosyltransferase involved in cell wall biosynthesis